MRSEADKARIEAFMLALGNGVRGEGRIYFAGGATALLFGWRSMTIDIHLKPDPEPAGLFEALALLREKLDLNIELASPDDFIPAIPGWRERSLFIARHGPVEFFHYDPYGRALRKLQRRHDRDLIDVHFLVEKGSDARVAPTSRVLVALFQRDEFFSFPPPFSCAHASRRVRDGGTPSPARETHALPPSPEQSP